MFSMIFGSDKFLHLVGELKMASMMDIDDNCRDPQKVMKIRQCKREIQLAVNLSDKLSYFASDENCDENSFRQQIIEEAKELVQSTFGGTLL